MHKNVIQTDYVKYLFAAGWVNAATSSKHRIPVCTKGSPSCCCWQTTNWSLYEGEKYPLLEQRTHRALRGHVYISPGC